MDLEYAGRWDSNTSLYYKNLEYGVDQTIYCYDTAKAMSEAAVKSGKTARIHIALDTGMPMKRQIP